MNRILAAVLLIAGVVAAGCDRPAGPEPERRLAACAGPAGKLTAGDPVKIEFRQGETTVASASILVGGIFAAPVPAAADIEVYADGRLIGRSGPGSDTYLIEEGCPASPVG